MGEDRSGARAEGGVRTLKPPPDRLYGRARGHKLRPRQETLLAVTLPRLALHPHQAGDPLAAFGSRPAADPLAAPALQAGALQAGALQPAPPRPAALQPAALQPAALQPAALQPAPPRPAALWLEVGFGGGEHALAQAATHPEAGLIACEVFENGICSLLSRLVPEGGEADAPLPPNLRLWPDDARVLLRLLPDACLDRLFLLFPDPWPKARHAKRRFVHPAMLGLVARVLKPGAEWRVASDDPTYQAWVEEVMAAQDQFIAPPPAVERPAGWPPTRYEAKALRAGRTPRYWTFRRRGGSN